MSSEARQRIAVIGAGISGLASAYFLARKHEVVLFEASAYLGGHTNTVDVTLDGITHPVDTGFLVFNQATYHNLIALLAELGVKSYATDMSFGVSLDNGSLEWAGTSLDTVFAQRRRIFSPSFVSMLRDILRFNARAAENLRLADISPLSLEQLLENGAYGAMFRDAYLMPMAAAIWSSSPRDILQFPASTFLRFCQNHALLQVNDRPQWQTVLGGGREYVRKIAVTLPEYRLLAPVQRIERTDEGVWVTSNRGREKFDAAICATHAPQTLQMMADLNEDERAILSAIHYQRNTAILHTDIRLMPRHHKVWSAWNYLGGMKVDQQRPVCVSYWLNKLQNLPFQTQVMVTLNPYTPPDSSAVLAQFNYEHPIFDHAAIAAQKKLPAIQGKNRVWFAGAWTGYGFHEDGLKSALRIASDFGLAPSWAKV